MVPRQGDQMSLWKKLPKNATKLIFLLKLINNLYLGKKVVQKCRNFQKKLGK
jgi:hypothetical protein